LSAAGNDFISGGDFYGADEIPGDAPDYLCGGRGQDWISGSPRPDHISAGPGHDSRLNGWDGADVVLGKGGDDDIEDWSCADCDSASDVLRGGARRRHPVEWLGQCRVYGGPGDDSLTDDECSPTVLRGGTGNDYIESWTSSFDGYGSCTCTYYSPEDWSKVADTVDGGPGNDSGKNDHADHITTVENTEIVVHGTYGSKGPG
jgi:hypothetical protein